MFPIFVKSRIVLLFNNSSIVLYSGVIDGL